MSSPRIRSLEGGFCKTRQLKGRGARFWLWSPDKRDLSPDQAYLCIGEGGSSGPQRPLCGAGSSQHAVPAETLPGALTQTPLLFLQLGCFVFLLPHGASLTSALNLLKDRSVLVFPCPFFPRTPRVHAPITFWCHELRIPGLKPSFPEPLTSEGYQYHTQQELRQLL